MNNITVVFIICITGLAFTIAICCCECCSEIEIKNKTPDNNTSNSSPMHVEI